VISRRIALGTVERHLQQHTLRVRKMNFGKTMHSSATSSTRQKWAVIVK